MEEGPSAGSTVASEVVVAETVFLLMTKEHRISKHLRAKWYLKHVNTIMDFPYSDNTAGHPQLLSVLISGGDALHPSPDGTPVKFKLATDTTVNFLSTHHDIVFAIDVSFSAISSSTADSEVLFDKMFESLQKCAVGLTKTFIIPGSDNIEFVPYFYATVIAYCPLEDCPVQQVLTHGYLVSHYNVHEFLQYISWELNKFENGVANYMNSLLNEPLSRSRRSSDASLLIPQYMMSRSIDEEDANVADSIKQLSDKHLSPEKGFFNLIKNAMLAIHLLPTNCSSGIIVITDGNVGIGDVGRYDNLLVQLLSQSCTCSIIEVQCVSSERRGLGRVPHSEMLQFIATATFGAYFNDTPCLESDTSQQMNTYHTGVLCWDFKKSIKALRINRIETSLAYETPMRRQGIEYKLTVPINCVITTRLKEGFTIKTVDASKEHNIQVIMVLPWRKNICIEYKASSGWPVPATNPVTSVAICYEGNYTFLHDLTCNQARTNLHTATKYRQTLVERFWKSIESLKIIDESLVSMQSFHTKADFSAIPDSIRKGKALFYCRNTDHSIEIINHSAETDVEQFSIYWRRVLCADLGMPFEKSGFTFDRSSHIMEKWFHITRIYMVLEHDPKHPEMLNLPNVHDRYQPLQCRQAVQALTTNLREWSDFELLENSHYVKYIHRQDNDTTPISGYNAENWTSFCMIILNIKGACVTLRLTFLGGTDSIYRTRLIKELKDVIQSLHFQKRPEKPEKSTKSANSTVKLARGSLAVGMSQHIPPLQRKWEDRQCCVLMSKPLDRVLVRYEQVPNRLFTVDKITQDISPMQGNASRLANYLYHQRWVWYLHPSHENVHFEPLELRSIGYILNIITKLRLQEGFHFAHTHSGIVSMILEVDMTNVPEGVETQLPKEDEESLSCLVQYITFPPQRRTRVHDSVSETEGDEDVADNASSELYMVTEVWIEPQHGVVANSTPERQHYEGCKFSDWPEVLFPVDQRCITLLVTLDHLLKYCTPVNRYSMSSSLVSGRQEKLSSSDCDDSLQDVTRVKEIPFVFSIIELLPLCQQVEIMLPTYHQVNDKEGSKETPRSTHSSSRSSNSSTCDATNNILFSHIISELDKHSGAYEMELTPDECAKFMKQVQDRPRDLSGTVPPLPFEWQSRAESTLHPDPVLLTDRDTGSPSVNSTARGMGEQLGSFSDRTTGGAVDSPTTTLNRSSPNEDEEEIPDWKCYCFPDHKATDKDGAPHTVTILFLPLSYKDLTMISPKSQENQDSDTAKQPDGEEDSADCHSETRVPKLNLDDTTSPMNSTDQRSLPLPIYLYHCSRSLLVERLVNNNTHHTKPDEYTNMRHDSGGSREYRISYRSDKSDESEGIALSPTHRRRHRNESCSSRRSFSRTQSIDVTSGYLHSYCEEMFYRSFVTGIFQSLQRGYDITNDDIEVALSRCMQSDICEVELTDFLRRVCSHMSPQTAPDNSAADQVFLDAATSATSTAKSVKFDMPGLSDGSTQPPLNTSIDQSKKQKRSSGSSDNANRPSNLRSPLSVKLPCSALLDRKCQSQLSAQRIKDKFAEVLANWFKPISSCKDVFYYSPPQQLDNQVSDDQKTNGCDFEEIRRDTEDDITVQTDGSDRLLSHSLSMESKDMTTADTKPLFVYLTANVHNERVDQSVPDIPVCLCELQEAFGKMENIDLTNAQITLDIICLTLANEAGDEEDAEEHYRDTMTTRQTRFSISSYEEIGAELEKEMKEALASCRKSIEWLVRDEIAAAMRSSGPITDDTLRMVAEHVRSSPDEKSCKYAKEKLRYVFGPESSHPMFLEEFVRMDVTGYQLNKCSDYYYLSFDRSRLKTTNIQNLQHLEDVAVILNNIHKDNSPSDLQRNQIEFDRSIEVLPANRRSSSKLTLARVSSLPGPKLDSSWSTSVQMSVADEPVKSSSSDDSQSVEVLPYQHDDDEDITQPIPISGRRDIDGSPCEGHNNSENILYSLPHRNPIDGWNRDDDEFGSKCGSLPKAFSSCNVNLECSSGRKILKRVSSGPRDLHSAALSCKPKVRHFSEDTGRKRATFADNVQSPPTNSNMFMRDSTEPESDCRSRNPSGPWTPVSIRNNGSMCSASETSSESDPGYEADFSDEEGTGGGVSLVDVGTRTHQMPDFWLIMRVVSNKTDGSTQIDKSSGHRLAQADVDTDFRVDVFFHTSSEVVQSERHFSDSLKGNVPKNQVFNRVLSEIRRTCKLVNQRLLLRDLLNKRRCDVLLEENWDDELITNENKRGRKPNDDSDGEAEHTDEEYLFARTEFKHGHFKCDLKWEKVFHLNPRLKSGKNKLSSNRGFLGLKAVLSNHAITNRSNMFVHKENQTENIFYLRLSECGEASTTLKVDGSEDMRSSSADIGIASALLSRSSSVKSITRYREDSDNSRRQSMDETEDAHSLSSSRASVLRRLPSTDDGVKLSVYGIDPVGSDIKVGLVDMLEARLDKTILAEIETLLCRNPNCMLTPQDVQFLQRKQPPTASLKLSLPDEVLHQQTAVLHYLRQNLRLPDFLFHPKCQDSDCKFMDYTESVEGAKPMIDHNTFLYNKSPAYHSSDKGAGLALIYLQLVDSANWPKTLLDCPKPDMDDWKKLDKSAFERLTQVKKISADDAPSKTMSTSTYIRFSIWSRGDIDLQSLETQLTLCVRHSLCDFVCEYYAFTAPLCLVPQELLSEALSTGEPLSLPNKGNTTPKNSTNKHAILSKAKSSNPSAFSFSLDHISSSRDRMPSPTFPTFTVTDSITDSLVSTKTPVQTEIEKYMFGEKGHLLPFYTDTLIDWLDYCTKLGMPALTRYPCGLLNECIVDPIMKEFESVVRELLPGVSIQAFRLIDNEYIPYKTSRNPLAADREVPEECEDYKHLNFPYSDLSQGHILTVRNRQLWIDSIVNGKEDGGRSILTPQPNSLPRSSKNNQKFPPAYTGLDNSLNLSNSQPTFAIDRQFLPRQQFLMLAVKDRELILYSYNLADGKDDTLQQRVIQNTKKITRWNNARFHLLNSVAHQKMGLFQHASIQDVPKEKHCTDKNVYTSTCEDTRLLAKSSRPTQPEKLRPKTSVLPPGSRLTKVNTSQMSVASLDKVFRGVKPTLPMNLSKTGKERDPIARHGSQLLETHKNEIRDEDRRKNLDKLYNNWLDRPGTEIGEDQLNLLKHSSRLVHHVATPLLLSPTWRNRALNLPRTVQELDRIEEARQTAAKQRSRNNSGTSVRSAKATSDKAWSAGAHDSPVSSSSRSYEEEEWHVEMRNTFVNNYMNYLRLTQQPEQFNLLDELRFSNIKIVSKPVSKGFSDHHRKHSSGGAGSNQLVRRRTTESLQMSMPGGIFLIELSFHEVYFVVKLYAFSSPQLSIYKQNYHAARKNVYMSNFIEMCDRVRDNTHCHSFSYDFHLRAVHKYVKSNRDFHSTYHLFNMLRDFTLYYEESPRFARNALAHDVLVLNSTNNPCKGLYDHILQQENTPLLKMKKIAMSEDDSLEPKDELCDYALVYHILIHSHNQLSGKRCGEYEASFIVAHDHHPAQRHMAVKNKLDLAFFVVLVNKEQHFPVKVAPHLLDNHSMLDISATDKLSGDSAISSSPLGMVYLTDRRSSEQLQDPSYVTGSQQSVHQLLASQCENVRETLTKLVAEASLQCRKSILWQQMRNTPKERVRRSASDVSNQSDNVDLLSFEEFEELLQHAIKTDIHLGDKILDTLNSLPVSWYLSLTKVLSAKYGKQYREFSRGDNQITHSIVLVQEADEVGILLTINSNRKSAILTLMVKEGDAEAVHDDEGFNIALSEYVNIVCFHMWAQMGI